MASFVPAEVFPPGVIIKGELDARGWTQADLAEVMERPLQTVNQIIGARKRVTEETAKELEAALGIEAEFWLKTEALYRLRHGEPAPTAIARRAAIRQRVPLRQMIARGWIAPTNDIEEMENRVKAYLGVGKLDEHPPFAMAAKQTNYDGELSQVQEAWLLRVKRLAETMITPVYSRVKLEAVVSEIRNFRRQPDDIRKIPKLLSDAGVRFVIVERLPGLRVDGVCFWLGENRDKPVIAMSLTQDRIDNFWFVIRHEIEHVLNGDGKNGAIVDNDLDDCLDVSEQERIANEAAAEFCVPQAELKDFMMRKGPLFTDINIYQFASLNGLHSGLVAGQLRKKLSLSPLGQKAWTLYTRHLAKIRQVITSTALVDGFGSNPQI